MWALQVKASGAFGVACKGDRITCHENWHLGTLSSSGVAHDEMEFSSKIKIVYSMPVISQQGTGPRSVEYPAPKM